MQFAAIRPLLPLVMFGALGCQSTASLDDSSATNSGGASGNAAVASGASGNVASGGAGVSGMGAGSTGLTDASVTDGDSVDAAIDTDAAPVEPGWTFVWSDEFHGPDIDESIWTIVDTPGTKGNKELEYYTNRKNAEPGANAFIEDDALVIEARQEALNGFNYTSARLNTQQHSVAQFQYGRMEARAKLPNVAGMWPAFWMLGTANLGWPEQGEIDIMEGKGRLPNWMSGALHRSSTPGGAGDIVSVEPYTLTTGNFHDDWHVFAVEWDDQQIRWYVDSALFQTVPRPTTTTQPWPFDAPFYFLLNLAVGGVFDNNVAPPADMPPQRFYVDYVRVFKKAT